MEIKGIATIDGKRRVVLPEELCKELSARPGDKIAFVRKGKTIRLHTMDGIEIK